MKKGTTRNRWIMYAETAIPGQFRVTAHESLKWCKASLERFSRDVGMEGVSANLYPYSDEDWKEAREFEKDGCPFDYPTYQIERGPRGALRIENL